MKVEQRTINRSMNNVESKVSTFKSNFDDSFNQANRYKSKEEIEMYIKDIKSIGEKIIVTQNYCDVVNYKKVIKSYLKSVMDYMYSLNNNTSFWESSYFKTVKIVDEKIESITRELIYEQKDNIDMAMKIDEINGLLIDLYL